MVEELNYFGLAIRGAKKKVTFIAKIVLYKGRTVAMELLRMRRSAVSIGRQAGLIAEITWKTEKLETICKWSRCYQTKAAYNSFDFGVQ